MKMRVIGRMIGMRNPPARAGKNTSFRFGSLTEVKYNQSNPVTTTT
jgi:hypothetical protein